MTLNQRTQAKYTAEDAQRAQAIYKARQYAPYMSPGRMARLHRHWQMYQSGMMSAQQFIYYWKM